MKGNMTEFLKLVESTPELARELGELAARYDFEFAGEEMSDDELDAVAGGGSWTTTMTNLSKQVHDTTMSIINNLP